jgi:branched-chain amino acid transport system ATP-binding protein
MMGFLDVQDIHTYYGDSHVLQGVNLKVEKGAIVAILGRNGAGKTTLIHSIIGFSPPRHGKITFKGQDITRLGTYQIARLGVGLIPQGRRVFSSLTVKENLDIAVRRGHVLNWSLDDVFSLFPSLRARFQSRSKNLSGGEQQMLACSRALVGNPDLLLLDEPSEGLAPVLIRELERVIQEIRDQELSMLLVEQNHSFALKLADYVYIMSRGVIVYGSKPEELKGNAEIKSLYLGV